MGSNRQTSKVKGLLFGRAYARSRRALAAGFYLESIVLSESLITERLRVILRSNSDVDVTKMTIGKCAATLRDMKVHEFDAEIWTECIDWSKKRNAFVHSMAHLATEDGATWRQKLKLAKIAAQESHDLVKRVSHEARKHRI